MGNGFLVYIISQIFITCALGLQGGTYFITNRHRQLVAIILSNTCSAICFFLLGGYVAVAMNIIAIARDVTSHVIYARRAPGDADKITRTDCWLLALWISLLTIGNVFTAHGVLSMLPYFSTMIFTIAIWQKSVLVYRFAGLLTNSLLIAYNIFMHNFMGIVLQSALLVFAIIGFVTYFTRRSSQNATIRF